MTTTATTEDRSKLQPEEAARLAFSGSFPELDEYIRRQHTYVMDGRTHMPNGLTLAQYIETARAMMSDDFSAILAGEPLPSEELRKLMAEMEGAEEAVGCTLDCRGGQSLTDSSCRCGAALTRRCTGCGRLSYRSAAHVCMW